MSIKLERNQKLLGEMKALYPSCEAMWRYFVSLTEIGRPSGHTEKAQAWAIECAKALGATVKHDKAGNVAASFPATKGKENVPGVVLQCHLDMVPTCAADHKHDFINDPIHAYLDGKILRAHSTTLGSDDGSGVAAVLALAEDKTLVHGPMTLLFTVDEEVGLVGAGKLVEGELLEANAKYLINVDSEDWGEICLSSAGGVDRRMMIPMTRTPLEAGKAWNHYDIEIAQLKGGHSGCEIQAGRGNALKWMAAMLEGNRAAISGTEFRIHAFQGGNAHNAIPSKCTATISVPADKAEAYMVAVSDIFHILSSRFSNVEKTAIKEPRLTVKQLTEAPKTVPLSFSSSRTCLKFIQAVHHGVWSWSEAVPTLVETSQSASVAELKDKEFMVEVYARSSNDHALKVFPKILEDLADLYGGHTVQYQDDAPGWPAAPESRLCKSAVAVYKKAFNTDPKLVPIHAGLECGIIINKYPKNHMEAISIGPTLKSPHTIDEHWYLDTAVSLYTYLHKLIDDLSN